MAKRKYLTDVAVKRLTRPVTGRKEVKDIEPGLSIRVTPNGRKSWSVVYRTAPDDAPGEHRTEKKRKTIGYHPSMGTAEARQVAREWMELAAQGIDPKTKKAEDKAAEQTAASESRAGSFRAVAADYVRDMKAGNKRTGGRNRPVTPATAEGRRRLLENHVLPALGDHALTDVTPMAVSRLLTKVEASGGPVDETLAGIRLVYKYAAMRGLFHGAPPTLGMTNRQVKKKRGRALTDSELKAIWHAAGEHGSFGRIVKLLMLTGQRRNEMAGLRWQEIDWDRRLLTIPVERVKNRAGAHEVPLTDAALQVLQEAKAACLALARPKKDEAGLPPDSLVFPSDAGETPISGWSKLKPLLDRTVRGDMAGLTDAECRAVRATGALRAETRALKAEALAKIAETPAIPWRLHDLRHTFVSRARDGDENAEGEVVWSAPLDVLQATVNHEITAGVTGRYDHGDIQRRYRLRKRELMEWWARKLMQIVGEAEPQDNVVQMPVRAG